MRPVAPALRRRRRAPAESETPEPDSDDALAPESSPDGDRDAGELTATLGAHLVTEYVATRA